MPRLELRKVKRTDPLLLKNMAVHYSQPKGFVGRNICYNIYYDGTYYGNIVAGSATLHLPGRKEFYGQEDLNLNQIVNNIFFHVEKVNGKYPLRNFTTQCLAAFRRRVSRDWWMKYNDHVLGFESLIELPRTGECYRRDGWTQVGQTVGYTCKRTSGKGTDNWTGKRVWDTKNLRPKLVFCKLND